MAFLNDKYDLQEQGTHSELMKKGGLYCLMISCQENGSNKIVSPAVEKTMRQTTNKLHQEHVQYNENQNLFPKQSDNINSTQQDGFFILMQLNRSQLHFILLAAFGSVLVGLSTPLYAVLYGELMGIFNRANDEQYIRDQRNLFSLLFLALAFSTGLGSFLETFFFSLTGERLAHKMKILSFESILSMDLEWFDRPENSVGSLCSQLQGDPTSIRDASGARIGALVQTITSISVSILIALILSWKLGLAGLLLVPIVLFSGLFSTKMTLESNVSNDHSAETSNRIAAEAISNKNKIYCLTH